MLSYLTQLFWRTVTERTKRLSDAVDILKADKVDFKFDGEMQPDVALGEMYKELYPFSEIAGNSNVFDHARGYQHSAVISYKMIKSMSRAKVIGPLLIGLGLLIEIAFKIFNIRNYKFSINCCIFSRRDRL